MPWIPRFFPIVFLTINATSAKNSTQRHQIRQRSGRQLKSRTLQKKFTKLQQPTVESLREKWMDLLSHGASNTIRLETMEEESYYYSAEILADKLLGLDRKQNGNELSISSHEQVSNDVLWRYMAIGSGGFLFVLPISIVISNIAVISTISRMLTYLTSISSSIHSSITPHLIPTTETLRTSIKNALIQSESILHSLPYLIRHLKWIQLIPLLIKIIRKCIILEAWRHIWLLSYKLTRRVWRGALTGATSTYKRICPAWIRRGIKNIIQSMVQAHIHGVVGSAMGGVVGGINFESFIRSTDSISDSNPFFTKIIDGGESSFSNQMQEVLGTTIDSSNEILSPTVQSVLMSFVENVPDDSIQNAATGAISEELVSVFDSAHDAMEDAFVQGATETLDSAIGDALDCNNLHA